MTLVKWGDFQWDDRKARHNEQKHSVSFQEAATVFLDDLSVPHEDPVHPERLILVGMSLERRVLLVVFAERAGGGIVRIISARQATRREQKHYEEGD